MAPTIVDNAIVIESEFINNSKKIDNFSKNNFCGNINCDNAQASSDTVNDFDCVDAQLKQQHYTSLDSHENSSDGIEVQQLPWEAPGKQGLYDPQNEHEACGVGFIVAIDGKRSHKVSLCTFP